MLEWIYLKKVIGNWVFFFTSIRLFLGYNVIVIREMKIKLKQMHNGLVFIWIINFWPTIFTVGELTNVSTHKIHVDLCFHWNNFNLLQRFDEKLWWIHSDNIHIEPDVQKFRWWKIFLSIFLFLFTICNQ